MGVEVAPVDKPNALAAKPALAVEIRNALAVQAQRRRRRRAADPQAGAALYGTSRSSLIVDPDDGACRRARTTASTRSYNLIDLATDKSVLTGTTFSRVSYDIPGQRSAPAPARLRDAEDRAARVIADNIQTRLASFFVAGGLTPSFRGMRSMPARTRGFHDSGFTRARVPECEPAMKFVMVASRERHRRLSGPARSEAPHHPALRSRRRPGARARRRADGVRRRQSQRSVLAGADRWRRTRRAEPVAACR